MADFLKLIGGVTLMASTTAVIFLFIERVRFLCTENHGKSRFYQRITYGL